MNVVQAIMVLIFIDVLLPLWLSSGGLLVVAVNIPHLVRNTVCFDHYLE